MERALINWLPTWPFILLLVIVISCVTTLIFFLTRHFIPNFIRKEQGHFLTIFGEIIIVIYAFLLGFVIISLWQILNQATNVTAAEANYLSLMTFDAFALPTPIQTEILDAIGQYIKHVVQDEWKTMRWGHASQLAQNAIGNLFHVIQSYNPQTETEKTFYHEIIVNLNNALENRRLRLNNVESALIDPLRFILIFGIFLISFILSLAETKNRYTHLFIVLIACSLLSFSVGLAFVLDYPFSGEIAVSNKVFSTGVLSRFQF